MSEPTQKQMADEIAGYVRISRETMSTSPSLYLPLPPYSAALDVAEYGGDENVFVISGKMGMLCGFEVDIGSGLDADTTKLVEWVERLIDGDWTWQWPGRAAWDHPNFVRGLRERGLPGFKIAPSRISLDAGGGGKGVYDACRKKGIYLRAERFGSRPVEDRRKSETAKANYASRRAQMYGELLVRIAAGEYTLPPGYRKLLDDLGAHENIKNKDGVLVLPPKPEVKKRLGRSPDWSDALVMAASHWERPGARRGLFVPGPLLTNAVPMPDDDGAAVRDFDEQKEARELIEWLQYR